MKQSQYDALHESLLLGIEMYMNEMITTAEFLQRTAQLRAMMPTDPQMMDGLLDPNTGLRFPFTDIDGNLTYGFRQAS